MSKNEMHEVHRNRLNNLRWLMEHLNVDPHEIAPVWNTSEQYLKQLLAGKHAKIGINIATRIEEAQELPAGWLSQDHSTLEIPDKELAFNEVAKHIPHLSIEQMLKIQNLLIEAIRRELKKLQH